ncbi:ankyrin-1-like [Lineus longissimus]|uniref:ankyrin-1-like n=1 Tax=Lineus longissimus TaxID=88925 RepID=UPI00315CE0AB
MSFCFDEVSWYSSDPSDLAFEMNSAPESDAESEPDSDTSEAVDAILEGQDPMKVYLADALHYALETDNFERAKWLVDHGADVNAESSTTDTPFRQVGQYPLEIAAEKNNPEMFEYLLSHGADTKIIWTLLMNDHIDSLTFFAEHPQLFKVILDDVRKRVCTKDIDKDDFDTLIRSVIRLEKGNAAEGGLEIFQMLLELQPPLNLLRFDSNEDDETLLSFAVSCQSLRFVKLIVELGTATNTEGGSDRDCLPLHEACNLHSGISSYCIPLHEASDNDDLETVMFLLEHGDRCVKSSDGLLPIDMAYRKLAPNVLRFFLQNGYSSELIEHHKLHIACFLEDVAFVEKLIRNGADVNALDDDGRVPLVIAIKMKNTHLIKLLLKSGADPEVDGKKLCSSNAIVAVVKEGSADILNVLLNYYPGKIDLNDPKHNLLMTAVAAENRETFSRLLQLGVDVCKHSKGEADGLRPIHKASELGNYQMLKTLIERGADVNDWVDWGMGYTSSWQRTPLAMCRDPDCIRLLLDFSADMYNPRSLGSSERLFQPCFMAVTDGLGDVEIMRAYWDKDGANLAKDFSIFNLACMKGYHELIEFLLLQNPRWKTECHKLTFFSSQPRQFHMFNNTVKLLLDLGCTFNFGSYQVYAGNFLYPDLSRTGVRSRDDKEWFGAQFYKHQTFVFTKLVQERCGHNDCLDGEGLVSLLTRTKDRNMIKCLHDCGHKLIKPIMYTRKRRQFHKGEADRIDFMNTIEQICQEPISLQNRCQIQIRRTLFAFTAPNCHIDQTIEKLPLPNCLLEFLSFKGDHEYQYLKYC